MNETLLAENGLSGEILYRNERLHVRRPDPAFGKHHGLAQALYQSNLVGMFTARPASGHRSPWFLTSIDEYYAHFMQSFHVHIHDSLYDYARAVRRDGAHFILPTQLRSANEAVHLGNTSSLWRGRVFRGDGENSQRELITFEIVHVEVDRETRKPGRGFTEKLKLSPSELPRLNPPPTVDIPLTAPPEDAAVATNHFPVSQSHIDRNNHASNSFCAFAFIRAVVLGLETNTFPGAHVAMVTDLDDLHITDVYVRYLREALLGDMTQTSVWENQSQPGVVHGQVKRGDVLLAQCKVVHRGYVSSTSKL